MKVIDFISGSLTIKRYGLALHGSQNVMITNDQVEYGYIDPWKKSAIKSLAPGGYSTPAIRRYHIERFRIVSGAVVPFSYALFWKNRFFEGFENDPYRCRLFVDLVYGLLAASVRLHPEFSSMENFVEITTKILSSGDVCFKCLASFDTMLNVLNLKASSEPYVADQVRLGRGRRVDVDQLSNICEISGCDCEDGAKYAYELKRLICESNWSMIDATLNGDVHVSYIRQTLVPFFSMTTAFFCVMYCITHTDICHIVTVLIDNDSADALVGRRSSKPRPIPIIKQIRMMFLETTAYSSPFQMPYLSKEHEKHVSKQKHIENCVSSRMKTPSIDVTASMDTNNDRISPFYKIFVNMMTIEYGSIVDYLPVKNGQVGFTLDDIYHRFENIRLLSRMHISDEFHSAMIEVIDNQLPSYIVTPRDAESLYDMYGQNATSNVKNQIDACINVNATLKGKHTPGKVSQHYIRVNVYTIDVISHDHMSITEIMSKVAQVLVNYPFIVSFDYRLERPYSTSFQTIIFNIFFYYDTKSQKIYTLCERDHHKQTGRFA
jgi:hypothetical protein